MARLLLNLVDAGLQWELVLQLTVVEQRWKYDLAIIRTYNHEKKSTWILQ